MQLPPNGNVKHQGHPRSKLRYSDLLDKCLAQVPELDAAVKRLNLSPKLQFRNDLLQLLV
jgi:hypothetical protein